MSGLIMVTSFDAATNTDILQGTRLQTGPRNGILTFEIQAADNVAANSFAFSIQLPNGDTPCNAVLVPGGATAGRSDLSPGWVSPGTEGGDSEGGGVSILTGGAEGSSEDLVLTDMKYIDSGGAAGDTTDLEGMHSKVGRECKNSSIDSGSLMARGTWPFPEFPGEGGSLSGDQSSASGGISGGQTFEEYELQGGQLEFGVTQTEWARIYRTHRVRQVTTGTATPEPIPALSFWGYSSEELANRQAMDPDLRMLLAWLGGKEEPTEGELLLTSPAVKAYWVNREFFCLDHNVLWRKRKDELGLDLVVPVTLQAETLRLNHNVPTAGHQGINRTRARMREKFYWYGLTADVQTYIASCEVCSKNKKPMRKAKWPMTEYHAGAPMERVHLDFLGPLPSTARGNEYVLMMVDQFTKWVECIPLPSLTAEVTAIAAVNEFFTRFGCPLQLHTDQGSNFESKLFKAVCELLQIHKTRTTSYRPSANGQVERYNRTLMDAVRCYTTKHQNTWDEFLPQIAGAIRSAVNRSTGYTPNRLMLGRELTQPASLMYPIPEGREVGEGDSEKFANNMGTSMSLAHETARSKLRTTQKRMKRDHDVKLYTRKFAKGDFVYMLDTAVTKGTSSKLHKPWQGPGILVEVFSPYLYRVKFRGKVVTANHDRLKKCRDRDLPAWLVKYQKSLSQAGLAPTGETGGREQLYCLCRGPDRGDFMIECSECTEWYHGACVNITYSESKAIGQYACPSCAPGGGGDGQ
jgi:transposase InsO family protein